MSDSIHISVARKILNSREPVTVHAWKADGSIMVLKDAVSLRYNFRGGYRNFKLLANGQKRKVRDVCIFKINDKTVYL